MNTEILNRWGEHFLSFAGPMLWQSSLLIAVVFAVEFALRRKIRAAIRHALWLVVLLKLLLPPSLALPTGPRWWIHPAAPPPPVKAPPVAFTVSYGEQMTPDFQMPTAPMMPLPKPPALTFAAWTIVLGGTVSAGLLAWLLIRWRQIHRKVRRANDSGTLQPVLGEAQRLACSHPGIRLKLTEDAMSPAVCGLFRPVILLPCSLLERLSAGQLRAVLLHELIHVRRGDIWVNCAQALLQIVYWWHPLFWLANARIRRVREEAVDDAVMLALRDDAEIYAPTLLEVAKFAFRRPLVSLGLVGILESRSALRQRIERLMDFKAPRKAGLTVVSILGILAFSAVALPMGQAPEKTNASSALATNLTVGTNAPSSVFGTNANSISGIMENTNFRVVLHALEQRTGVEKLAAPESVATAGRQAQQMRADYVFQQLQYTSPGREAVFGKLNSIRLESVNWADGIALSEALRFLNEQSRLLDPDRKGVNFIFNPGAGQAGNTGPAPGQINPNTGLMETVPTNDTPAVLDPTTITIKLKVADITLHDVLDTITLVADPRVKYSVEDYGVVFSGKPNGADAPTLETRVFKVDPYTFAGGLRGVLMQHTNQAAMPADVAEMALTVFGRLGVNLTPSAPGRSLAYNLGLGLLLVKATPPEMDTVEKIVQALNQTAPQIHSKTKFLEVPAAEIEQILKAGTAVDTNTVVIIAADKMKSLLSKLESSSGVKILAEPESVVVAGRQVQMRSANSTVDLVPMLLMDGYTLNLQSIVSKPEIRISMVKIWEAQTLALVLPGSSAQNRLVIFVTSWLIDPAGNRVHSDDDLRQMQEKAKSDIPPQHTVIMSDSNSIPGIMENTNFRVVLHALEQRTGVQKPAEPEPFTTAGQGANLINRIPVPDKLNIPSATTNAIESAALVQDGKLLYEMGKFAEAETNLNQALKLNPNNAGAIYYLSLVKQAIYARALHTGANFAANNLDEVPKAWVPKVGSGLPVPNPYATNQAIHTSAGRDPNSQQLEMRVFKVDTNAFASGLRGVRNLPTNDVVTMAKEFFNQLGVDLSAPGRSIFINDRLGLLFVRATPSELDSVERVIQALNQVPPQIHIKAWFIEVPKDGFVALPQLNINMIPGQMTGILTGPEFRTLLRDLEHRQGVEMLAEPECVTTSGRQTQMRATDIDEIITNFTSNSTKVVPQIGKVEIGPSIDIVPYVLSDGYTINLTAIPQLLEFLGYDKVPVPNSDDQKVSLPTVLPHFRVRQAVANVNLWDDQTLVLGNLKDLSTIGGRQVKNGPNADDKELIVFVTATIVDPAGNRVHSDDEMPFNATTIPPQPNLSTPSR